MSGPSPVSDLVFDFFGESLTANQARCLHNLLGSLRAALRDARACDASIDRRAISLTITKLEEAEHWAMTAVRATAAVNESQPTEDDSTS